MKDCIAERRLLFSLKDGHERKELIIRIGAPYLVEEGTVNFPVGEGTAGCSVDFDGLPAENLEDVYGADLLQALQLAADVEPTLERLSKKYDFYFPTGEPYFDPEDNS
jgi:hypothetical protein